MAEKVQASEGLANIDALQQEAAQNPNDREIQRRLGWTLFGLGRLEEARAAFEAARERWPEDIEFHYGLGLALKQLGQVEQALASFEQALSGDSESVRAAMLRRMAEEQKNILEKQAA